MPAIDDIGTHLISDVAINTGAQFVHVDVVVSDPSCVSHAGGAPGHTAEDAARGKFNKYVQHYGEAIRSSLVAFSLKATGRLGTDAVNFINEFARRFPGFTHADAALEKARLTLFSRLSIVIARSYYHILSSYRGQVSFIS